jgi:hypothetical protein
MDVSLQWGGKQGTITMVDLHAGTILKTEVTFGTLDLSTLAYSSDEADRHGT